MSERNAAGEKAAGGLERRSLVGSRFMHVRPISKSSLAPVSCEVAVQAAQFSVKTVHHASKAAETLHVSAEARGRWLTYRSPR